MLPVDEVILAPDVYVNASVALGSPPEHVTRRVLGGATKPKTSKWILARIEAMLSGVDAFKPEMVEAQMKTIHSITESIEEDDHDAGAWTVALVAAAKAAKVKRVITDHPDLADQEDIDGVSFLSSDAWLVEVTTPPPAPGT